MVDEDSEGWTLTTSNRRVDQIQLDYRFGILLDDSTLVVIESPFRISLDGTEAMVIPERVETTTAALRLLHRTVNRTRAFRTGGLRLEIEGGGRIEVEPGDGYENWQVILPDGHQ